MKSPYISELQPNQLVTSTFLVQSKDIRLKKTGEPYLSLVLADRTGDLDAKMWDNAEEVMETFERNDFIRVRGLAQIHQNRLQLNIQKLQRVEQATIDISDFFPASKRDPEEMFAELRGLITAVENRPLCELCLAFLDDQEIASRLKKAPAAKSVHHAYLGGLLEHVLSMMHLGRVLASHYGVDFSLLSAGILLHDIGKIYELSYDRSFGYTTEGHLLGHIQIGMRMLDEKLRLFPEFPAKLRLLVEHMILSHHGQLEFGSPKAPMFPEALLLHHLDNLDSKMECMRYSLEKDRMLEGYLTSYNPALERQVFKKEKYLQSEERPAQSPGRPEPGSPPLSTFGERLQAALKQSDGD